MDNPNSITISDSEINYDTPPNYIKAEEIDKELLIQDIKTKYSKNLPIEIKPFPIKPYKTGGNGYTFHKLILADKQLICASFSFSDEENSSKTKFLNLIFEGDFEQNIYDNTYFISSRNHPHYLCQAKIIINNDTFEIVGVTSINKPGYVLINGKIIDLTKGNIIAIKPSSDYFTTLQKSTNPKEDIKEILIYIKKDINFKNFYLN